MYWIYAAKILRTYVSRIYTLLQGRTFRGPIVRPEKVDSWAPDLEQCINSTDICSSNVGSIYPIQIYIDIYIILQNVHSLTLRPKGAQKPSKWHISSNCWYDISNTTSTNITKYIFVLDISYQQLQGVSKKTLFFEIGIQGAP